MHSRKIAHSATALFALIYTVAFCIGGVEVGLDESCAMCSTRPSGQGQQQNANVYSFWSWDKAGLKEAWNVDQEFGVVTPNVDTFWTMTFTFSDLTFGGYIGLQTVNGCEDTAALFSLWHGTEAKPAQGVVAKPFGGEGTGYQLKMDGFPLKCGTALQPHLYNLRVWRLNTKEDGVWWSGVVIDKGAGVERPLGSIFVPASLSEHAGKGNNGPVMASSINIDSIKNFAEYYGPSTETCDDVPVSTGMFGPPMVNREFFGTRKGSTVASCTGGQVRDATEGRVLVYLGGKRHAE